MPDFMDGIIDELADDCVIRACLAGEGKTKRLAELLVDCGFLRADLPYRTLRWRVWERLKRLIAERKIIRAMRGLYVACCPACREPILNVRGTEH
jgi:hypothetical protein